MEEMIASGMLTLPRIAQGCMRIAGMTDGEIDALIKTDLECGINFFDHADIYGRGVCEERFGAFLKNNRGLRGDMIIQTKCSIRKEGCGYYDSSPEYINASVEGSLRRLGLDCVDVLLLHRPDALIEPEKVGQLFDRLHAEGKVRYFGVSNYNAMQIELLQKYCNQKLLFNQLQFGPAHSYMMDAGTNVNTFGKRALVRDGSVLDYCRLHGIVIQPWSPFRSNDWFGTFFSNIRYIKLNKKINALCDKYRVSNSAIVIAWILRHPAMMQPVIGTTSPERVKSISKACDIELTREEWYEIYTAASGKLR